MRRLELTRLRTSQPAMPGAFFPGDRCPEKDCSGKIGVDKTIRTANTVTRYLKCRECGFRPDNKLFEVVEVVPTM